MQFNTGPLDADQQDTLEDDWTTEGAKEMYNGEYPWTGTTSFHETAPTVDTTMPVPVPTDHVNKAKGLSVPKEVTDAEREAHELTHLPMRDWCELCTKAKGRQSRHTRKKDDQPIIQVDYCFMKSEGTDVTLTLLCAVDCPSLLFLAALVKSKGGLAYAVKLLVRFIYEVGRTYGILQSDGENPITSLCTKVVKQIGGLSVRRTPGYSSETMATIGKLQSMLYGQIRVLKLHVEIKYALTTKLDITHAIIPWIVLHATWLLNRYQVHTDGLTSFQRRWNRSFDGGLCALSECVHWRKPGKHYSKMDPVWSAGLWLGEDTISGEAYVSTELGSVIRVRSVKRLPPSQQYQQQYLDALRGTPEKMRVPNDTNAPAESPDSDTLLPPQLAITDRMLGPTTTDASTGTEEAATDTTLEEDLSGDLVLPGQEDSVSPEDVADTNRESMDDADIFGDYDMSHEAPLTREVSDQQRPQPPATRRKIIIDRASASTRPSDTGDSRAPTRQRMTIQRPLPVIRESEELPEADTREHKSQRVDAFYFAPTDTMRICGLTLRNGHKLNVHSNEEDDYRHYNEQVEHDVERLPDPIIDPSLGDFPEKELAEGMNAEMVSLEKFDVYDEVPVKTTEDGTPLVVQDYNGNNCIVKADGTTEEIGSETNQELLDTRWVNVWKGLIVKSRLTLRGFKQIVEDKDSTYASTPLFVIFKLLVLMSLALGWSMYGGDVCTAFLHAVMTTPLYIIPPPEYYSRGGILWKLKKAMYGLKSAPRDWQDHLAGVLTTRLSFKRLMSDSSVYYCASLTIWLLVYVDDFMVFGPDKPALQVLIEIEKHFLIKRTGQLNHVGDKLVFVGRQLTRLENAVTFGGLEGYYTTILESPGLTKAKKATTTGPKSTTSASFDETVLDTTLHRLLRSVVGKLLWLVPIRPDLAYSAKELSRCLVAPTQRDYQRLKHLGRYVSGTIDLTFVLRPLQQLQTLPKQILKSMWTPIGQDAPLHGNPLRASFYVFWAVHYTAFPKRSKFWH